MRCLGALVLLCAACSDPATVARRTVDGTVKTLLTTDARLQSATKAALFEVATRHGRLTRERLVALQCPDAAASQPAACTEALRLGRAQYEQEAAEVVKLATKADQALDATWKGLRVVVELLEVWDAGNLPLKVKLLRLVAESQRLWRDALAAYEAVKLLGRGTP